MPSLIPEGHSLEPFRADGAGRISAARLLLIEANRTKAELWRFCCTHKWGFDVVACCQSGAEGVAAAGRLTPDLILAGLDAAETTLGRYITELRDAASAAKLILLSHRCNEYLVHTLRGLDYHGFVFEPDETLASLALLIDKIRQGHRAASPSFTRCQTQLRSATTAFPKLLSVRQEAVLVCIAHSMTDEEIGLQLGCTTATALSHRQKIMKKLNVHSTPKLIRYCTEKGFNTVPPPLSARPA